MNLEKLKQVLQPFDQIGAMSNGNFSFKNIHLSQDDTYIFFLDIIYLLAANDFFIPIVKLKGGSIVSFLEGIEYYSEKVQENLNLLNSYISNDYNSWYSDYNMIVLGDYIFHMEDIICVLNTIINGNNKLITEL